MTVVDVEAFYLPDGEGVIATPLTRGPWDVRAQHAGPPGALLARTVEAGLPEGFRLARLTLDLLRPVPITRLVARAEVTAGRRVARARVVLEADGVEVVSGTGMGQLVGSLGDDATAAPPDQPLAPPEDGTDPGFFGVPWDEGWHTAMAFSFLTGSFTELGPATVWLAMRVPLVAGEEPSPFQRTMVAADAGNGVSAVVDFADYTFVNPDLSVHLHRDPVGQWVGLDAATVVEGSGAGLASTIIHDRAGPIGRGNQTLLVTAR